MTAQASFRLGGFIDIIAISGPSPIALRHSPRRTILCVACTRARGAPPRRRGDPQQARAAAPECVLWSRHRRRPPRARSGWVGGRQRFSLPQRPVAAASGRTRESFSRRLRVVVVETCYEQPVPSVDETSIRTPAWYRLPDTFRYIWQTRHGPSLLEIPNLAESGVSGISVTELLDVPGPLRPCSGNDNPIVAVV